MPSNVWFTSDPHFGHALVARLRGWDDVMQYNEALIERFNEVVKKSDQTWWLGDMSGGSPLPVFNVMPHLNGEHHLVTGNHDRCNPMFRDAHKWQPRFLEHFASVQPFARRRIGGLEVLLSHYPYKGYEHADRGKVRYGQYRLPDHGRWLLHGHLHTSVQYHEPRQIHVGMDAWGLQPVNLDTIATIIETYREE